MGTGKLAYGDKQKILVLKSPPSHNFSEERREFRAYLVEVRASFERPTGTGSL